ncbi:MAG: hypothetical protein H0V61_08925 [Chitinophagales bacterium]|nr:hypothetical protein [Chitinophagales bacterium]
MNYYLIYIKKILQPQARVLKTFLCAFLILASVSSYCQNEPVKEWDVRFGGSGSEGLYSVQQTADNGFILGGDSDSPPSGDKTQPSQGLTDYWIVKTDVLGNKQWDKRYGGDKKEQLYSAQQTTDGGYILAGWSESGISGQKTQPSNGSSDYWILKVNANGNKQWDARYGGSGDDELRALEQTADGGYIMAGTSNSGISGDKTQINKGENDFWMVKADANGVKQWDKDFGGSDIEELNAVHQTADGGYILGGWSRSGVSGDKSQPIQGINDYWIVKTDENGVKLWDARYGGSEHEYLYSLEQTSDGGYIIGGYSESDISGDKTQMGQGGYDFWIVKTNESGVKQWDATFGGSGYDKLKSIIQTLEGGYIMAGWSESGISGDKTEVSLGLSDYWVIKTDANGAKTWDSDFGGANDEKVHRVLQTIDGGFLLAGHTFSGQNGDISQPTQGANDYWILKLSGSAAAQTFYEDADGDSYGDLNSDTLSFSAPAGYVQNSSDCNDANSNIHPGEVDVCNNLDDNCDLIIDENAIINSTIIPEGYLPACAGEPVVLNAYPASGVLYQWWKNGHPIPGATNKKYTTTEGGLFEVMETNDFNCTATPEGISIQRIKLPEAVITPEDVVNSCEGETVTLSANDNSKFTYQWYNGTTKIVGATNAVYTTDVEGSFSVEESVGPNCPSISSPTIVNFIPKPAAEVMAMGDLDICLTGSVTLKAIYGAGITYQWKKGTSNIIGATNKFYKATIPGNYKVVVTNGFGCSKTSPVITVYESCKLQGSLANTLLQLLLYPNPSDGIFTLYMQLSHHSTDVASIHVTNVLGQDVFTEKASLIDGGLNLQIQIRDKVPEGIYLVRALIDNVAYSTQLQIFN